MSDHLSDPEFLASSERHAALRHKNTALCTCHEVGWTACLRTHEDHRKQHALTRAQIVTRQTQEIGQLRAEREASQRIAHVEAALATERARGERLAEEVARLRVIEQEHAEEDVYCSICCRDKPFDHDTTHGEPADSP